MRPLEEYITVGTKRLRCGYTIGTCAAAAARAAAELLFHGTVVPAVVVDTPAGIPVTVEVEEHELGEGWARCAVRKDSGDDPDVTDGVLVHVRVEWGDVPGVRIDGGIGVGRVTRAGLDQPVGAAAINSVPRKMIREQVEAALRAGRPGSGGTRQRVILSGGGGAAGVEGSPTGDVEPQAGCGVLVTVSIPAGVELAARTFNPRLGIEGGISVIGTSGIVRPMSEDALVKSIELELRTLAAQGKRDVLVVPGNYGRDFAANRLELRADEAVQCSNYFGATIDAARMLGFERMLIVGHLGKMAKVAAGVMNTHSRVADCRVEALAAHAALAGASRDAVRAVMESATTDAALDVLIAAGVAQEAMASLVESLAGKLAHRAGDALHVEAIVFSNVHGVLGQTPGARGFAEHWHAEEGGGQ
ncbi:MAG: cobalt-precorrin-5B (C(1))-methyltransferase CbiD [Coriobacteriaceae bacterium]|nr:cobalt-precorrin-5B (C(1))-methyltransferase CbiD [Coriobacteriaceae bacterium]